VAESLARADGQVNCRLDRVAELLAQVAGQANCRPAQVEESLAALAGAPVELVRDRESVSFPREDPAAARLSCLAWATGQATLAIARASFQIEHRRSVATIFKTALHRAIGMIASKTVKTGATTGKIDIRTFMTAMRIGITDAGATTAIGGATCGAIIPR